jgi:hypothetical protein
MTYKYYAMVSIALLTAYENIAKAADITDLSAFGFIQITEAPVEEIALEKILEKAATVGCNILVDPKILPKTGAKNNQISFAKRTKAKPINNHPPFDQDMKAKLLAAIKVELDLLLVYAKIQDMSSAEAKIDSLYVINLPPSKLVNLGSEFARILWRGCRPDQLALSLVYGSAGGEEVNEDSPKPTEEEAKAQVGEIASLPEFTNNTTVLAGFGTNNFRVAFKIKDKYLTDGSKTENGFICSKKAPVEVLAITCGRKMDIK